MSLINEDPRIDPRIKATVGAFPSMSAADVENRQQLLDEANSEEAIAQREQLQAMMDMMDNEDVAPSGG